MTASIVQNDGGGPINGSIDNGSLSTSVALSNYDNTGVLGWFWELVYKPQGSSAAIAAPNASATSFTTDVNGTYLVRLTTYTDAARTTADDADEQCYAIRLGAPYTWRIPAGGETVQYDPVAGWAPVREAAIRDIHAFMTSFGGLISGFKIPARVTSTGAVVLATGVEPGDTIDGVVLAEGDRVLLRHQSTASENGLWVVGAAGAPSRPIDFATGNGAAGAGVYVTEGSANQDSLWFCTTDAPNDVIDTNNLAWVSFGAPAASYYESGGGDPINGCNTTCAYSPTNYTPTGGGNVSDQFAGIDTKLGTLGAQAVTVDADGLLQAPSGTEVGSQLDITVNKAAGDYVAERTNVVETAAPGTANKLKEWTVGGTPRVSIYSDGGIRVHDGGTDASPGLQIDRGSGGAVGITNPGDSQLGLVANNEKLVVDNDGATPTLRPDVADTWVLGELAYNYSQVYAAQYDLVTGGVNYASFAGSTGPNINVSKTATLGFSIVGETQDPGVVGVKHSIYGGKAGIANGATAPTGGQVLHKGGEGGNGDATYLAGIGGKVLIEGGDAGVAGAGGGNYGGEVDIRGGVGTGVFANGSVKIGIAETEQVEIGAIGKLTWNYGDIRNDGELHQAGRIRYTVASKTESGTTRSTTGSGGSGNDDDGQTVKYSNASGCTVTVNQAYDGCRSKHVQLSGAGTVTLAAGSGVTLLFDSTTFTTAATVAAGAALYLEWLSATLVLVEGGLTP